MRPNVRQAIPVIRDTPALVDVARLRVAITGAPHTGKTTLAYQLASQLSDHPTVVSTDSYQHLGWSECSARVAEIVAGQVNDRPWSGIVEGVAVPRVLRKLLRAAPTVRPVDRLIILEHVHGEPLTARQAGMGQGLLTVLLGPVDDQVPGSPRVLDALRDLGVAVEVR